MAINISTDINVTTGGKLTDVGQIQGGWKSVDSASDAYALTGSATTKGLLEDGQIFYVKSSEELLSVSITGNPPFQTYSFSSFNFPGSGGGSGDITSVVAGDGLSGGASTGDATLTLDTSSAHFTNAVSASAATAGFGSGGGANYDGAISSSTQIAALGAGILSGSISTFPFTGSAIISGGLSVTGSINNITIGRGSNSSDFGSTAIGYRALENATSTANNNTAIGADSMLSTTTGTGNVAVGRESLYLNEGGDDNVAIGESTLRNNVSGDANVAVGRLASQRVTGNNNTSLGTTALTQATSADDNTAIGHQALFSLTTSEGNVALGKDAGRRRSGDLALQLPSASLFLGAYTKASTNSGTNEIVIGYDTTGNGSNTVTIGNSDITNNYFSGEIDADDITIDGWGSVSASLAAVSSGSSSGANYDGAISSSTQIAALGAGILSGSISTFPFTGSAEITGSLRVDGRITALGEPNGGSVQNNIVFPTNGFGLSIGGYQHITFSKSSGQISLRGKRTPGSVGSGGSNNIGGVHIANDGGTKVFEYYDSGSALQLIRMQTGDGATDLQVEITGALGITGFPDVSASLAEALSAGGSGDITSVVAGDGLSGGASTGDATLTLDTSSQHFIDAVNALSGGGGGIFSATGSIQSTTNNLEITGSLTIADGLLKLKEYTTTPSAVAGGIFYSASALYFGVD